MHRQHPMGFPLATLTHRLPPRQTTSALLSTPPSPPAPHTRTHCRTVAFTTPQPYADRLSSLITHKNWDPLWCPTVTTTPTPHTLFPYIPHLDHHFSAIAFPSRTAISAFLAALSAHPFSPLGPSGAPFTLSALGTDAELLDRDFINRLCAHSLRVKVLVPPNSTPSGLVQVLGPGLNRRILCPVPVVIGLEEPPVVPSFIKELESMGWVVVRVGGYETRWAGRKCTEKLMDREADVDGIVFTSTAEVEGLLKGLAECGLGWADLKRKWAARPVVVAAHGPVTAAGAERFGVQVDIVSSRFSSFEGIIQALDHTWATSNFF